MASASINTKQKNISLDFIRKTAGYIAGATGGFISDIMPVTSSTISGAKTGLQELNSTFSNTASTIVPKINQLKLQAGFKNINNWFMQRENDFDDFGDIDTQLDFDVETDPTVAVGEAQISELGKNANQISKTMLESSHKVIEAQVSATANLVSSTDRQTAVISSGFDKTNTTLNKILEVLAKNTSTLIEATVANNNGTTAGITNNTQSSNDRLGSGKFRFDEYRKMVTGNIKNSELGMISGILSMATGMGGMFGPKDLIQMGIGAGVTKFAPNMKSNMKALDSAIGDVITGSLIRVGEHRNDSGLRGKLAQIFGIDSSRRDASTQRSSLELKSVPYDSMSKESLVGAIPGYLRHILIAAGGPDLTYDFKSRSFKEKSVIRKEFRDQAISSTRGSLNSAGGDIKKNLGDDKFTHMMYDLMMNDLGSKNTNGEARKTISKFGNKQETEDYVLQTVLAQMSLSDTEKESAKKFAGNLGNASLGMGSHQMMNQVARNNVNRNKNMKQYTDDAESYGMDLSFINDNANSDKKAIARSYGKSVIGGDSNVNAVDPVSQLTGANYTNMALYEIYRRLNEGVNVFQVGSGRRRRNPFEKLGDDYLTKPLGHKPKQTSTNDMSSEITESGGVGGVVHDDGSANLLQNQELEDGTSESLSGGARFGRWGKQRGGNLAKAMFSGNSEQVKDAFGLIVRDVSQIGGEQITKGLKRVNDSFGNVGGFMKHKLFGTGYAYDSGETDEEGNAIQVRIKDNKGGGAFGFVQDNITSMFKSGKDKTMKWVKDVAGYFDYRGTGNSSEDRGIESKRKSLLFSSAGAMAGAGLLGGPLGLLVGAVAGNALSVTGMGDKIKGLLFGKEDPETGKRDRKGLVTRAVDGIIDPIKYQVGKSFNFLSKIMKKNVLGPLSDVGMAIKNRITDAVSGQAKSTFGKVFGFIGKALMSPFKAIAATAKLPINLMGSIFRGVTGAAGSVVGTGLGTAASLIAGGTTKDEEGNITGGRGFITQRKKDRNAKIEEDYKNDYSGGYKDWKTKQDERRTENSGKLKDSMKEERMTQEEMLESNRQIEEHTATAAAAVSHLDHLGSEAGSIFTHDQGLHGRIDSLIELMGGGKNAKMAKGTSDADKSFVDSVIGATGSMMSADGIVSMDEARLGTGILDEAAKGNPSKSSVISKFKNLIGIQSKRKEDNGDKKESWFTKLLKTLSDNWVGLLAGAVGALALFNTDFKGFASGILGKFGDGLKNLADYIMNGDKDKKDKNTVLNTVTAPLDMKTDYASNYLNPFASISHVKTDGAGDDITNINATRAKNAPWQHLSAQTAIRGASAAGYEVDKNNAFQAAKASKAAGDMAGYKTNMSTAADASRESKALSSNLTGKGGAVVQRGMTNLGVGLAGGQLIGKGAGLVTSKVLQNAGVSDVWADRAGRVAETAGTIKGTMAITQSAATEGGAVNKLIKWATESSVKVLESLGEKIGATKTFAAAAKPISEFIGKAKGSITEKAMVPLIETVTKLAAKVGVQVSAGVLTAGLANAAMAGAGAILQGCNTENLFGVLPDQADALMTTIASGLGAIFNLPFVCLVEIIDVILAPVNNGKGVRQTLAEIIYNTLKGDGGASLSEKQGILEKETSSYNTKFGTGLDKASYNDMVNQGMMDKIWTGGTKMEDGHAVFDDKGSRVTNGGIKGLYTGARDKVSNEYNYAKGKVDNEVQYASNKVSDIWSGKNVVDENGKEVLDEDGKAVKSGGLKEWGSKTIGKFSSTIGTMFAGIGSISKDFMDGEYERDEKGDPIIDENGNAVRKGGFKQWAVGGIGKIVSAVTTPIKDAVAGATEWVDNESEWAKGKLNSAGAWISGEMASLWKPFGDPINEAIDSATNWVKNESSWAKAQVNSAGDWISTKISSLYNTITQPINDFVDGAKEWVTTKADWGITSVKDWIAKKADSGWDYISAPFKGLFSKGDQANKDQASITNRGGKGGGSDETIKPPVQKLGGIGGPIEKTGDPLNKPFEVTSPFGERVHPVTGERKFHKGIDLVPEGDVQEAQIGAVYDGKVTATGFEDGGAGNYVFYETNDGLTIKNMHMKDNSIPSNIQPGATIKAGDKLGDMGSTGGSTGPHLHYQIEKDGTAVDPAPYIAGGSTLSNFNSSSAPGGSSSSSAPAASGPLGALLGNLKNVGTSFLNKVSGGLMPAASTGSKVSAPGSSGSSAKFAGLTGTDTPEKVYNFLRGKGCSHEAAIGILANMQQESGIDPTRNQDGGPAHGIVQWEGGRFDSMSELAASHGKDWTDLESQLEFLWSELSSDDMSGRMSGSIAGSNLSALGVEGIPGGFNGFKSINDSKYATALFEGAFERAGLPMMENRYGAISALDQRLKGTSGGAPANGGKGGGLDEMFSKLGKSATSTLSTGLDKQLGSMENTILNPAKKPTPPVAPKVPTFIPNTTPITGQAQDPTNLLVMNPLNQANPLSPQSPTSSTGVGSLSGGTSVLEGLLSQVLLELKAINGNTGQSSSHLASLNENGIQDNGVRDSITQLGKVKQKSPQVPYSAGNTRSVNSMIKP